MTDLTMQLALIVVLGVSAQWIAYRTRLPSILLLLALGFAVGPGSALAFGRPWLNPDVLLGRDLLFGLASIAVAVILFEGGMSLQIRELRRVGAAVLQMATVGVVLAWVGATAAAHLLAGFDFGLALLLGAVLVVTGPTVITPLLRQIKPSANVASVLKWEGIVNDPTGAILAVLVFEAIRTGQVADPSARLAVELLLTIGVGAGLGLVGGFGLVILIRRFWVPDQLDVSVVLMTVLLVFGVANAVQHEAGLLAVTVMGVVLGNQKWAALRHILDFKEHLASLLVAVLFILLAARCQVEDLRHLNGGSFLAVAALIVVVRPVGAILSTGWSGLRWRERAFIAFMAPRGVVAAAVTSLFALRLEQSDLPPALAEQVQQVTPFMLLVILATIVVYGLSALPLARWLGVSETNPKGVLIVSADRFPRALGKVLQAHGFRPLLVDTNLGHIRHARMEGLQTWFGDVLTMRHSEHLDLQGIGWVLILTPNDQANSLIGLQLSHEFGRNRVFRIHPVRSEKGRPDDKPPGYARVLIGSNVDLDLLNQRLREGWVIKATKVTESFDYAALRERYPDGLMPIAVVDDHGRLQVSAADAPLLPKPGHTVIALFREPAEPKADSSPAPEGSVVQAA